MLEFVLCGRRRTGASAAADVVRRGRAQTVGGVVLALFKAGEGGLPRLGSNSAAVLLADQGHGGGAGADPVEVQSWAIRTAELAHAGSLACGRRRMRNNAAVASPAHASPPYRRSCCAERLLVGVLWEAGGGD